MNFVRKFREFLSLRGFWLFVDRLLDSFEVGFVEAGKKPTLPLMALT
jgi:hypothetical protein